MHEAVVASHTFTALPNGAMIKTRESSVFLQLAVSDPVVNIVRIMTAKDNLSENLRQKAEQFEYREDEK
jgi:hypothetical protein